MPRVRVFCIPANMGAGFLHTRRHGCGFLRGPRNPTRTRTPYTRGKNPCGLPIPVPITNSESSVTSVRSVPPPLPGPSPIRSPDTLPTTSLLTSVTESTPSSLTPSPHPASPSIRESLWAPETDYTYESSILAASPSVQSISMLSKPFVSQWICWRGW
jgi:hypothetical protein